MSRHAALASFMNDLTQTHGLHLCIKDYTGFIASDRKLKQVLLPYLGHNNAYCLYIKQNKDRYRHCLSMMKKMAAASLSCDHPYCGACYAGIKEYVIPIFADKQLLGVLTAGFLPMPVEEAMPRLHRAMAGASTEEITRAQKLYETHVLCNTVDIQPLLPALEFIAAYLSLHFRQTKYQLDSKELATLHRNPLGAEALCQQILDFLDLHAHESIHVAAIAEHCHCSSSTVSHVFKKYVGFSLSTYVNKVRIERAKELLLTSEDTIESVCIQVGYNDANYFSRMFKQLTGYTPSKFRLNFR